MDLKIGDTSRSIVDVSERRKARGRVREAFLCGAESASGFGRI
jgi:hypothetical protein